MCLYVLACTPIIIPYILAKGVEPLLTKIICGNCSDHSKWIDIADFVIVYRAVDTCTHSAIGRNNIGNLQAGNVESLARGDTNGSPTQEFIAKTAIGSIYGISICELAMNLIGNYKNIVLEAYAPYSLQFIARPHTARRVVWVAEHENFGTRIGGQHLEIVEIYAIVAIGIAKKHVCGQLTAIIPD